MDPSQPTFDPFGLPDEPDRTHDEDYVPIDPLGQGYAEHPVTGYGASSVPKEHRHPFTPYLCSPVRRVVNGTPDSFPLDFKANTILVNNYTPQFAYIDSANFWVPPNTVGWVIRCVQASDEGRVYWGAPAGVTQPAAVAGALLTIMWLEEVLPPVAGVRFLSSGVGVLPAPNGVDDTANIAAGNNAVNAAGGGVLQFQPGTYTTTASIIIFSNVAYVGSGCDTTVVKLANGANVDLLLGQNFATLTGTTQRSGPTGWTLRDIALDGNKANNASGWVMRVFGFNYKVLNVDFGNGASGGVWTEWGDGTGPTPQSMEALWVNFKIHDNNGVGLNDFGPHDTMFTQGVVFRNTGDGIFVGINNVGTQLNGGIASVFTSVHSWGNTQQWAWNIGIQALLVNCEGEGGTLGQVRVAGAKTVIQGGQFFNANGTASLGIVIDNSANRLFIDTSVFDCLVAALKIISGSGESTIKLTAGSASAGVDLVGSVAGDTFLQLTSSYNGVITGRNQIPVDTGKLITTVGGVTSVTVDDGAGNLIAKTSVAAGNPSSQISSDGRYIAGATRPDRPQIQLNVKQSGAMAWTTVYGIGRDNNDALAVNTKASNGVVLWNDGTRGAQIRSGSGAPTAVATDIAGDIYHRIDTPTTANQRLYICTVTGTTWVGIL